MMLLLLALVVLVLLVARATWPVEPPVRLVLDAAIMIVLIVLIVLVVLLIGQETGLSWRLPSL